MHPRSHTLRLRVTPLLLLAAGCTEPRNVGNLNPSLGPATPIETTDASQPAPGPKPEPSQSGIIGQRTTDIRRAEPELQKGAGSPPPGSPRRTRSPSRGTPTSR